jgi:hypothetical protein
VLRQRERDFGFFAGVVRELSEHALAVLLLLQRVVAGYRTTSIPPLVDEDVRGAASALAATFETSAKGIIYEHHASSLPAQRLAAELRRTIDERIPPKERTASIERDVASALRRLEWAAKEARLKLEPRDTAYLDLAGRISAEEASAPSGAAVHPVDSDGGPRIVVP